MKKTKFLSLLVAGAMLLPTTVAFAEPSVTPETVDTSKTGSITLVKTAEPSGAWIEANGLEGEGIDDALPIKNITFKELKIADIEQYLYNGEVGTYYTNLNADFAGYLDEAGYTLVADKIDDTKSYYTAKTLEDAVDYITKRSQFDVEQFVDTNEKSVAFTDTDTNGRTVMTDMDLGLYLIAETDVSKASIANSWLTGDDTYAKLLGLNSPNTDQSQVQLIGDDGNVLSGSVDATSVAIANKTVPYLISIPTTNTATVTSEGVDYEAGTVWMYDVVSYPKNTFKSITKMIVDQDDNKTLRMYEDYEIGDTINQVIFADVTAIRNGKENKIFEISDTMSESLTFEEVTSVTYGLRTKNPTTTDDFDGYTEFDKADYTVNYDKDANRFVVSFTDTGLAKLDALDNNYLVVVNFDTVLNSKAKIGTEKQNMNQPELKWQHQGEPEYKITGNKVYVFTYEIDVTKDGLDDLSKATFRVQHCNAEGKGDGVDIQLIKEEDGVYHLFDSECNDKTDDIVTHINPNKEGKLYVKGVDSKQYVIVEVSTESGHNLLKYGFDILITAPEKAESTLDNPVADATHRDGTVTAEAANQDSTGKSMTETRIPLLTENGVVYITIHNNEVITIHTGGSGTYGFYIAAALLVLLALGVGVVFYKKRKAE